MHLDLELIALGSVIGVAGAAVATGTGRQGNQQIKLGEASRKSPGRTELAFMKY
jgi:hypothetical protein